jgi:hypothetical protein
VRRYIESNDIPLLIKLLEFERVVALIAVYNEQAIRADSIPLYILVKVL